MRKKIYYYSDENNDEVIDSKIEPIKIDGKYRYIRNNIFVRILAFVTYRLLATPIVWIYVKIIKRISFKNTRILKMCKNQSFFIYGNHSNMFSDGFSPALICFPKKPHVICSAENVSMRFWGGLTPLWGALPLPDTLAASKNFNNAMDYIIEQKNPIVIYPEAHLWPYYTGLRDFSDKAFRFPIKYDLPVYTFSTTYSKRKFSNKPKTTIWVDGPFFPDENLDLKSRQTDLRNKVYDQISSRLEQFSEYDYVEYIKR